MQDEVHRFTINYHRQVRSKGSISSFLDGIDDIGEVRKKQLIKKFGNVTKITDASIEELDQILPHNVSLVLKDYLLNKKNYKS
jgi:excinuclease ABC subunit C